VRLLSNVLRLGKWSVFEATIYLVPRDQVIMGKGLRQSTTFLCSLPGVKGGCERTGRIHHICIGTLPVVSSSIATAVKGKRVSETTVVTARM